MPGQSTKLIILSTFFLEPELLTPEEANDDKLFGISEMKKRLSSANGIQIDRFESWSKLEELRLVGEYDKARRRSVLHKAEGATTGTVLTPRCRRASDRPFSFRGRFDACHFPAGRAGSFRHANNS